MAQFDVHELGTGELVLDCQSDLVSGIIQTRLVLPLLKPEAVPDAMKALHPRVTINGLDYLIVTQLAAAVPSKALSKPISSLESHRYEILNALDFLISGV